VVIPVVARVEELVPMRLLRSIAAVLIWLVASLLLVVSIVLCITILLLPVGIVLGFASLRLYAVGFGLLLPRSKDVEKGIRRQARRWWRKSPLRELSPKRTRRARKIMRLGQ
jgi:hypothetical protein